MDENYGKSMWFGSIEILTDIWNASNQFRSHQIMVTQKHLFIHSFRLVRVIYQFIANLADAKETKSTFVRILFGKYEFARYSQAETHWMSFFHSDTFKKTRLWIQLLNFNFSCPKRFELCSFREHFVSDYIKYCFAFNWFLFLFLFLFHERIQNYALYAVNESWWFLM